MPFDYKKEYKEFYLPKDKPSIVTVPSMNYIAVRDGTSILFIQDIIVLPEFQRKGIGTALLKAIVSR